MWKGTGSSLLVCPCMSQWCGRLTCMYLCYPVAASCLLQWAPDITSVTKPVLFGGLEGLLDQGLAWVCCSPVSSVCPCSARFKFLDHGVRSPFLTPVPSCYFLSKCMFNSVFASLDLSSRCCSKHHSWLKNAPNSWEPYIAPLENGSLQMQLKILRWGN